MQNAKSREQTNGVSWINSKRNKDSIMNNVAANRNSSNNFYYVFISNELQIYNHNTNRFIVKMFFCRQDSTLKTAKLSKDCFRTLIEFHLVAEHLVVNGEKYSCANERCKESLKKTSNSHAIILARQQSALPRQLAANFK